MQNTLFIAGAAAIKTDKKKLIPQIPKKPEPAGKIGEGEKK